MSSGRRGLASPSRVPACILHSVSSGSPPVQLVLQLFMFGWWKHQLSAAALAIGSPLFYRLISGFLSWYEDVDFTFGSMSVGLEYFHLFSHQVDFFVFIHFSECHTLWPLRERVNGCSHATLYFLLIRASSRQGNINVLTPMGWASVGVGHL